MDADPKHWFVGCFTKKYVEDDLLLLLYTEPSFCVET
jgi:hypothetical protein